MKKNKLEQILVVSVAAFFALVYIGFIWVNMACPKCFEAKSPLTFGNKNASVQIVLFEDFNCKHCKIFAHQILPSIKEKYIDTNKIGFTIVPLAFGCGSDRIANAVLSAYEINKNSFFPFLESISQGLKEFDSQESFVAEYAKIDPKNLRNFKVILQEKKFVGYLQDNLYLAKQVMRNKFKVPTLYINGTNVSAQSLTKLENTIEELLLKKEG